MGGEEKIDMNNDRQVLGKRIAKLRKERGWTQEDLATRMGMSPRAMTLYERQGPPVARLNQIDAVFGGALLAGTPLETLPLEGMTAQSVAATNGTSVPRLARSFAEVARPFAEEDARDLAISTEHAADQDCVTAGVEPLGLLLDGVLSRLRSLERRTDALEKAQANR